MKTASDWMREFLPALNAAMGCPDVGPHETVKMYFDKIIEYERANAGKGCPIREHVGLERLLAKLNEGKPLLPDPELGQDVAFVAYCLNAERRSLKEAHDLIQSIEWIEDGEERLWFCPMCEATKKDPSVKKDHDPGCAMAKVVSEIKKS